MAAYKKNGISPNGFNQGTFFEFCRRLQYQMLTSAVLAIKAGSSALVKSTEPFTALVGNVIVTKADNTDMAALSGTVAADLFNIYVFYVDSAGTLTSAMGTAGATYAAVIPPVTPVDKTAIGAVLINPTGTGDFVGGTSALDDGTIVPNASYCSFVGHVDLNLRRDLLKQG
jgi:hypothetical protein